MTDLRKKGGALIIGINSDMPINRLVKVLKTLLLKKKVRLIFNMSSVTSPDNEIFEILRELHIKFADYSAKIDLFGLHTEALTACYIMNYDKYLNIYDTEDDAIKRYNPLIKRNFKIIRNKT